VKRGDLVLVAIAGDYGKPRPALIVQSDLFNETHASITVAPVTSTIVDTPLFRITVEPSRRNGLRLVSQVMVDKVTMVRRQRCGQGVGRSPGRRRHAPCEPSPGALVWDGDMKTGSHAVRSDVRTSQRRGLSSVQRVTKGMRTVPIVPPRSVLVDSGPGVPHGRDELSAGNDGAVPGGAWNGTGRQAALGRARTAPPIGSIARGCTTNRTVRPGRSTRSRTAR
jgi:mRNA interferase MazF